MAGWAGGGVVRVGLFVVLALGVATPALAQPDPFLSEAGLDVGAPEQTSFPMMIDATGQAIVRSVSATGTPAANRLWCLPLGRRVLEGTDRPLTEAVTRPAGWPDDWEETLARRARGPGFVVLMIARATREALLVRLADCDGLPEVLGLATLPETGTSIPTTPRRCSRTAPSSSVRSGSRTASWRSTPPSRHPPRGSRPLCRSTPSPRRSVATWSRPITGGCARPRPSASGGSARRSWIPPTGASCGSSCRSPATA
ncbi:MAG: hypothetical protein IT379_42380 [Deltaproteobacteria bacterium]|nr:hypothetical protein [Deltaproteobacteria bacterium]